MNAFAIVRSTSPFFGVLIVLLAMRADGAGWRDESLRATLKAGSLEAGIQGGLLCELKDGATGRVLLSIDPGSIPGRLPVFGAKRDLDLDKCEITQESSENNVTARWRSEDGTTVDWKWTVDSTDDLVLQVSAKTAEPVEEIRAFLLGADIAQHRIVWIDGYGVGKPYRAPWSGALLGDPLGSPGPSSMIHPQVALFEGEGSGWFVEGREDRIGPAATMVQGRGETADIGMLRRFAEPTDAPVLYEIRIRAYRDHWEDAVDPYVKWMEEGVGFVPLKKKSPSWIGGIQNQAYIRIGDFAGIENLAKRVDANRTFLGRMVGAWIHPMDYGYPDYTLNETAKSWIKRARELGFHVGVHFNTNGISKNNVELLKRFRDGLIITGKDEHGNETYYGIDGPNRHVYCSAAYKPWRDYFIEQIKPAIDAGVDVVYLDESMAASGRFYIDGMTAIEGVMQMEKEILEAYPHVAIETEQFNPMSARHASFALSQMPLGHPLSGYIFSPFIHIVAEGIMGEPTDESIADAWASWGFMRPNAAKEESWLQIAKAFQDYDLVPDSRLPRRIFRDYASHPSHGMVPVEDASSTDESEKLFGYRGKDGVTAYFEKRPNRRTFMLYEPNQPPRAIATRVTGVSEWPGPGVLREYISEVGQYTNWLIYDGNTMLALDPARSYLLDEGAVLPQDRFHVTAVPDDYAGYYSMSKRIRPTDVGKDESWYRVNFSGHGVMKMYVPDDCDVYLDGQSVEVNRDTRTAEVSVAAETDKPSTLLAFRRTDVELVGPWVDLPWQNPPNQRSWYVARHQLNDYSADGPVRMIKDGQGYYNHVGGAAVIVGRLPQASIIRVQGAFGMREESQFDPGDGVVRINGKEVARVPGGPRPYQIQSFDVDVSSFAGQYVLLEFGCEGNVHGAAMADWFNPQILVGR